MWNGGGGDGGGVFVGYKISSSQPHPQPKNNIYSA